MVEFEDEVMIVDGSSTRTRTRTRTRTADVLFLALSLIHFRMAASTPRVVPRPSVYVLDRYLRFIRFIIPAIDYLVVAWHSLIDDSPYLCKRGRISNVIVSRTKKSGRKKNRAKAGQDKWKKVELRNSTF